MSPSPGELAPTQAPSSHRREAQDGSSASPREISEAMQARWPRLHRIFRVVDRIVYWSDTALPIPGTRFRFGLDPIVGLLFPGAGDAVGGVVSLSVVLLALQYRLPVWVVARMVVNLALDAVVGSVPLVGDVFDFGFRANQRNMDLLRAHAERTEPASMPKRYYVWGALLLILAVLLVALPIALSVWLITWLYQSNA